MARELDNQEIGVKFETSRVKIKEKTTKLVESIDKEIRVLEEVKKKHPLNEQNMKLINSMIERFIDFKAKLLESWKDTLKEE